MRNRRRTIAAFPDAVAAHAARHVRCAATQWGAAMPVYSLARAATLAGRSRSTVLRAIYRKKIPDHVAKEPVQLRAGIAIRADDLAQVVDPEEVSLGGTGERHVIWVKV